MLVIETLGAPSPPSRRRRKPKPAEPDAEPSTLALTRVTAVRAETPFEAEPEAARWLQEALAEEQIDATLAAGIDLLNRALHAQAVAGADPRSAETDSHRAVRVRIGYGSGEEVAAGRFSTASEIDPRRAVGSPRRRRLEEMRPQERTAAILGGREQIAVCETLLLRARADLDAGRRRETALQLRIGLEALLVELAGALADPGHETDMAVLEERRGEAGEAANVALRGDLDDERERSVRELVEICERVLRRRRVLRG